MYVAEYKKKEDRAKENLKKNNFNSRQPIDVKIHVRGLDPRADNEELTQLFANFGNVKSFSKSKFNNSAAVVCYATRQDALNAISGLDQQCINGRFYSASMWQSHEARKLEMEEQRDRSQYTFIKNAQTLNQPINMQGNIATTLLQVFSSINFGNGP